MKLNKEKVDEEIKRYRDAGYSESVISEEERLFDYCRNKDSEVFFEMRDKGIGMCVYAAREHMRISEYLVAEWNEYIRGPDSKNPMGESASDLVIRLLSAYKKMIRLQSK